MDFEEEDDNEFIYTYTDIKTLGQPQQHRFRKNHDVERLRPIHGNLDKRATEALKYLVEVRIEKSKTSFTLFSNSSLGSSK